MGLLQKNSYRSFNGAIARKQVKGHNGISSVIIVSH